MRARDHLLAALIAVHVALVTLAPLPELPGEEGLARVYNGALSAVRDVAYRYGQLAGTHQWWSMFSGVGSTNRRVEIAVRIDGQWHDVYIHGTDADWNAAQFDQGRWREMFYNLQARRYPRINRRFVEWVAELLFVRHPRADRVRVRITVGRTPRPEDRWDGLSFDEVEWRLMQARPR